MRYSIRQQTTYEYDYTVAASQHAVRLIPMARPGIDVLRARLQVEPAPAERFSRVDFFGNRVVGITFETAHERLDVVLTADVIVVDPPAIDPEATPPWEEIRNMTSATRDMGAESPIHGLFPSRGVGIVDEITEYAAKSFPTGRPVLAGAFDLTRRIRDEFVYDPKATDVTTSPAEAFARQRGVCQDFAQVMIAGLRGLGLPAMYVSGYLRTIPPPGEERLEGADATHAWARAWCGPDAGWVGLDPTNAVIAGEDHITAAIGRDYLDVAPISGVIVSAGEHHLTSTVDVIPLEDLDGSEAPPPAAMA
ncbi:MAG: transglutaminase N-terminal domain-containing protein [Dehalococcoidia bacterium]